MTPTEEPMKRPPAGSTSADAEAEDRQYSRMLRTVRREWEDQEARGDDAVQLSRSALNAIKESVRADARHGAQVRMPPTPAGPYTVTELALRTLVRESVDSVPDATALRSRIEHEGSGTALERGHPVRIIGRISARWGTTDLLELAEEVRSAIREACQQDLGLDDVTIDIHIEDLHDETAI